MRMGDMVKIKNDPVFECTWPESEGAVGMIVGFGKRLHIPAVKVLVLGQVAEFDLDEVQPVTHVTCQ